MSASYEHFSRGDKVRVDRPWRSQAADFDWETNRSYVDHDAGVEGFVTDMSNAGFRGLEYAVETWEGRAFGISADDLTLVDAVEPLVPWGHQNTYRGGRRIQGTY